MQSVWTIGAADPDIARSRTRRTEVFTWTPVENVVGSPPSVQVIVSISATDVVPIPSTLEFATGHFRIAPTIITALAMNFVLAGIAINRVATISGIV